MTQRSYYTIVICTSDALGIAYFEAQRAIPLAGASYLPLTVPDLLCLTTAEARKRDVFQRAEPFKRNEDLALNERMNLFLALPLPLRCEKTEVWGGEFSEEAVGSLTRANHSKGWDAKPLAYGPRGRDRVAGLPGAHSTS